MVTTNTTPGIPRRESFDQQAAGWLREAIIFGKFAPGSRLTEVALADEAGLSRSTMRTALLHLANEGIVDRAAYSGWRVASLTASDCREVYTLRSVIDGLAARLAATDATDADLAKIKDALERLLEVTATGDHSGSVAIADIAFHREIVIAAHHARLLDQYERLGGSVLLYMHATNVRSTSDLIQREHLAIWEAVASRDSAKAEKLAVEHVLSHGELLEQHLREAGH